MVYGFLGVVVIIALETVARNVGACLQLIPMIYRSCGLGVLLGVIGCVVILQPIASSSSNAIVLHIVYPLLITMTAFIIALWQWIPSPSRGVATVVAALTLVNATHNLLFALQFWTTFCFGISTSVVFHLLPLPTLVTTTTTTTTTIPSSSPSLSSSSSIRTTTNHGRKKLVFRSAFGLTKVQSLLHEGHSLAAAIIIMLVGLQMEISHHYHQDSDDDDNVMIANSRRRQQTLTSIRVNLERLEQSILPQIQRDLVDAHVEIQLLPCLTQKRHWTQQLTKAFHILKSILPIFQFLNDIVRVNQMESEWRMDQRMERVSLVEEDPLWRVQTTTFVHCLAKPTRILAQSIAHVLLLTADTQHLSSSSSKDTTSLRTTIQQAHQDVMTALTQYRYHLFYHPNKKDTTTTTVKAQPWGYFARGVSFIQGMDRVVRCIVIPDECNTTTHNQIPEEPSFSDKKNDDATTQETDDGGGGASLSSLSTCCQGVQTWFWDLFAVSFAGVQWTKPILTHRDDLRYALNFAVQVGLASLWFAIPVLNDRMNNEGIFVLVTTCFISLGKFGLSFQKSVQRILATAIASTFALFVVLVLQLNANQALNATYPYILLCLVLIDRKKPYIMICAAFTAVIFLFQLTPIDTVEELFISVVYRIATVGTGIMQFIVVEMVFFYDSARTRVEEQSRKHVQLIDDAFRDIAAFIDILDTHNDSEDENDEDNQVNTQKQEELLEVIQSSIDSCKTSTKAALADHEAAQHEPGATIDVKPPFVVESYAKLLSVQSSMNSILSQILGCCRAVTESPKRDTTNPVYRNQVKMIAEMVDCVRDPLKQLTRDYEQQAGDKVWLRDLRHFNKSRIKEIGNRWLNSIQDTTHEASDHTEMVEQSFAMHWFAISRCLILLCDEFARASSCFETIASSHPNFRATEYFPPPVAATVEQANASNPVQADDSVVDIEMMARPEARAEEGEGI